MRSEKKHTLLSAFLQQLGVKHTRYADNLYNSHPYKFSLYGLSQMLSEYKVANAGMKVSDKKSGLEELAVPFIAHAGNEFVLVYKKDSKDVSYLWNEKDIRIGRERFLEIWSGNVLLAEADEESCEPDYERHRRFEWWERLKGCILFAALAGLCLFAGIMTGVFSRLSLVTLAVLNAVGLYTCLLLLKKQMRVQSEQADKICSLFKKSDCNSILQLKEAKLWGVISWSEMGFGYFISNLIVLFIVPSLIPYMVLIGGIAILFSFWSVWFQKIKVKQWCPLCLIVQLLFWILGACYLLFGFVTMPVWSVEALLGTACIYALPPLTTNLLCERIGKGMQVQHIGQQMNALKMRDEVVTALLKAQDYYPVDETNSKILFGNPQANLRVTVLTNPHCEPCGTMHKRIENLLEKAGDRICVQYIFTAFDGDLETSSKELIAVYLHHPLEEATRILHEWYTGGKYEKDDFFKRYPEDWDDAGVLQEFNRHQEWKKNTQLTATPTILINGYKLPREYRIEDVAYFVDIKDF